MGHTVHSASPKVHAAVWAGQGSEGFWVGEAPKVSWDPHILCRNSKSLPAGSCRKSQEELLKTKEVSGIALEEIAKQKIPQLCMERQRRIVNWHCRSATGDCCPSCKLCSLDKMIAVWTHIAVFHEGLKGLCLNVPLKKNHLYLCHCFVPRNIYGSLRKSLGTVLQDCGFCFLSHLCL